MFPIEDGDRDFTYFVLSFKEALTAFIQTQDIGNVRGDSYLGKRQENVI